MEIRAYKGKERKGKERKQSEGVMAGVFFNMSLSIALCAESPIVFKVSSL